MRDVTIIAIFGMAALGVLLGIAVGARRATAASSANQTVAAPSEL